MKKKEFSQERIQVLENYIHIAKNIVREAYRLYDPKDMRLVWSGHKDSTLTLWIWKQVCDQYGYAMPKAVTLDEGDPFDEVEEFLEKISQEWDFVLDVAKNEDVLKACNYQLGADVHVKDLNKRNQEELERIGFGEITAFPFEAESFIGNHLMKSVALNEYLEANDVKVIVQGLRWDEQPVRADDLYIEEVEAQPYQPAQVRVRPILHIDERALWDIYSHYQLPYVSLYEEGYRSLGVKTTTTKTCDIPAWEQDLENTVERAGRRQDKEAAMARLRMLGYM
jgi:phosphoadenosine phosphosulfate reductase